MKKKQIKKGYQKNKTSVTKQQEKMYGTVTVGSRGQIVIPAKARRDFKLQAGDQVLVMGNSNTGIMGIVKADGLNEFVRKMTKHLVEVGAGKKAQEKFKGVFKSIIDK